jgi:hypothetical protein
MINFELNDEETKLLQQILGNYHNHLDVEIRHTDTRDFREALQKKEKALKAVMERLAGLAK